MVDFGQNKVQRFFWFLPNLAVKISVAILVIALLLSICFAPLVTSQYVKDYYDLNWLFEFVAIICGIGLALLVILLNKRKSINFKKLIIVGSVVLFVAQIFIIVNFFFIAG